jgi:hypothetical protein
MTPPLFAGYAKVSQEKRGDWHSMTQQYFTQRATLLDILLLVDASLPPKDAVRRAAALQQAAVDALLPLDDQEAGTVDVPAYASIINVPPRLD